MLGVGYYGCSFTWAALMIVKRGCVAATNWARDEGSGKINFGHFAVIFGKKRVRIRTKPKKTGKNLWKPKIWD
jgi:hypothetical protein